MMRFTLATVLLGAFATAAAAEQPPPPGLGEATFQRICAACHTTLVSRASPSSDKPVDPAILRAPPRELLRQVPPESVLAALTSGKMQAQGAADKAAGTAQKAAGDVKEAAKDAVKAGTRKP